MPEEKRIDKIETLSIAKLLAKAINNIYLDRKMSEVYINSDSDTDKE